MNPSDESSVLQRLSGVRRMLVAAHIKPDGDAVGASAGFARMCRDNGLEAVLLLPDPPSEHYLPFLAGLDVRTRMERAEAETFDCLVLFDCARPDRAALGPDLELGTLKLDLVNVDHHMDSTVETPFRWVAPFAAAAAMACELGLRKNWKISPEAATLLLLGLITDTGSFRFGNTTPEALRTAATLLECGGNLEAVVNAAFFSKSRNRQAFEADMLSCALHEAADGRYLYAALPDEMFARHNFDMRDGDTLIELLREVQGVTIAALLYRRDGKTKVSLRSKDTAYPVGPLARKWGGGGHEMAAGITLDLPLAEAAKQLENEVVRMFAGRKCENQ